MTRFNLWLVKPEGSKIICYGSRDDMNALALAWETLYDSDLGDVYVLPDCEEPIPIYENN